MFYLFTNNHYSSFRHANWLRGSSWQRRSVRQPVTREAGCASSLRNQHAEQREGTDTMQVDATTPQCGVCTLQSACWKAARQLVTILSSSPRNTCGYPPPDVGIIMRFLNFCICLSSWVFSGECVAFHPKPFQRFHCALHTPCSRQIPA
jgi:hypothetical protein